MPTRTLLVLGAVWFFLIRKPDDASTKNTNTSYQPSNQGPTDNTDRDIRSGTKIASAVLGVAKELADAYAGKGEPDDGETVTNA